MENVISYHSGDNGVTLFINGEIKDKHLKAQNTNDLLEKLAYMVMRHLDNKAYFADCSKVEGLKELIIKKYFSINGEDKWSEYFCYLKWYDPNNSWNKALARLVAYDDYVKLVKAGFTKGFAAQTAFNMHQILINPDKREIFDIFRLKEMDQE